MKGKGAFRKIVKNTVIFKALEQLSYEISEAKILNLEIINRILRLLKLLRMHLISFRI
jgi:ribosomal protein L10